MLAGVTRLLRMNLLRQLEQPAGSWRLRAVRRKKHAVIGPHIWDRVFPRNRDQTPLLGSRMHIQMCFVVDRVFRKILYGPADIQRAVALVPEHPPAGIKAAVELRQQGNVLFYRVPHVLFKAEEQWKAPVELVHRHTLYGTAVVLTDRITTAIRARENVWITHPERKPLPLTKGVWLVSRVQKYDHLEEEARNWCW